MVGASMEDDRSNHFVQLYESDEFLIGSIARFIAPGLNGRDAAVVVATEEHREGIAAALVKAGVDVDGATATGRFVSLDAADLLARFVIDDRPDPIAFMETVGAVVARVAATGDKVRIFGEMVALLWARGKMAAAAELEEMWNDLAKIHPFTLFCAYPMRGFEKDSDPAAFESLCDSHGRVIPAESYTNLSSPDERLRRVAALQQLVASEGDRIRKREAALEQRQMLQLNDVVVQGLTVAKMALETGEHDMAMEALTRTLQQARALTSQLFDEIQRNVGPVDAGDLLGRDAAFGPQ